MSNGEFDTERLALSLPVDADGEQHAATLNDPVLADLLTCVEHRVDTPR